MWDATVSYQTGNRLCFRIGSDKEDTSQIHATALNKFAKGVEKIFKYRAHELAVQSAYTASKLIDFKTLDGCHIYSGMAIGTNKYLKNHQDKDYAYSMVTVLAKGACKENDTRVLAYFCFPRLGIAVPLCSGDVLMFNPQEPHCLSSRCHIEHEIVCMSIYLKSSVVGLNDNKIELAPLQKKSASK
jgi:hypothetical protein